VEKDIVNDFSIGITTFKRRESMLYSLVNSIRSQTNKNIIITISRQLGCGGAYIGQEIAKQLGIMYADREIINKAAEKLSSTLPDCPSFFRAYLIFLTAA
jgi:2-phosphoglycerate kinase